MAKQDFLALLNGILTEERSFWDIQNGADANGTIIQYSTHHSRPMEYDRLICFLIYLNYLGIINFEHLTTKEDLLNAIVDYNGNKKALVTEIWDALKDDDYPYYDKLLPLITSRNLSEYKDEEYEKVLLEWGNTCCLGFNSFILPTPKEVVCFKVIRNCQKQLGIDMDNGDILIHSDIPDILFSFMRDNPKKARLYFYNCHDRITSIGIALLLDYYSNISILSSIDDKQFDGIVSLILNNDELRGWESWTDNLKDGGFCMSAYKGINKFPDFLYNYDVPLMIDFGDMCILYRKAKDKDAIVRYGIFRLYEDTGSESFYWEYKLSECIKNNDTTSYYEEIRKDDFKYTGTVRFNEVRRKSDQRDFVWVKKTEVIIPATEGVEWLWNTKLKDEFIIDNDSLSKDPFSITAKPKYYLNSKVYQPNSNKHILEECKIEKKGVRGTCHYYIPMEYVRMFDDFFLTGRHKDETTKEFGKALCCRVLTSPAILYNGYRFLRVNATPDRPVCFRGYDFIYYEDLLGFECVSQVEPVRINPDYDEKFMIYQLLNQPYSSDYILVAPSKQEQRSYFSSKRIEYLNKFQEALDEQQAEVNDTIDKSKINRISDFRSNTPDTDDNAKNACTGGPRHSTKGPEGHETPIDVRLGQLLEVELSPEDVSSLYKCFYTKFEQPEPEKPSVESDLIYYLTQDSDDDRTHYGIYWQGSREGLALFLQGVLPPKKSGFWKSVYKVFRIKKNDKWINTKDLNKINSREWDTNKNRKECEKLESYFNNWMKKGAELKGRWEFKDWRRKS